MTVCENGIACNHSEINSFPTEGLTPERSPGFCSSTMFREKSDDRDIRLVKKKTGRNEFGRCRYQSPSGDPLNSRRRVMMPFGFEVANP